MKMKRMDEIISITLILGLCISVGLVLVGGTVNLIQYGHYNVHTMFLQTNTKLSPPLFPPMKDIPFFSAIGLIKLGLFALIGTQLIRVGLLFYFYTIIRDHIFSCISLFILLVMIYSLLW